MSRRVLGALALALLLSVAAAGQMQEGYLDYFIAKVKPEKRAEFDALIKRMVDSNRRHKGDAWLTTETVYGEHNTVYFGSLRRNYAEMEQGFGAFMGALNKAYGPAGTAKLMQDFNNCLVSSRSEVRRRRPDLSANAPADAAALSKLIGESRWARTVIVRVRPGRLGDYQAQLQTNKAAAEKATPRITTLISQSAGGQQGTVFYITTLRSSLAGFDTAGTPLPQLLGQQGYQKYLATARESVLSTETIINRFVPELSNPPEEIVSASPDFWRPKPAPAAKAKAKPAEGAKPQ